MGEIVKGTATAHRQPVATVSCPSGKRMTGGGGRCLSVDPKLGWTFIKESYPSNANEWRVQCDTPVYQSILAEVFAVCN